MICLFFYFVMILPVSMRGEEISKKVKRRCSGAGGLGRTGNFKGM